MKSKIIGVIGGGQLGLMIVEAAHQLGAKTICLDPCKTAPASLKSDDFIQGDFNNIEDLKKLGDRCDVLTYEFENISGGILKQLENQYCFRQGILPLLDSQNRLTEKENANKHGLKTAKFLKITSEESLQRGVENFGFPCIFKTSTLGYDGHGQVLIKTIDDLESVKPYLDKEGILEEFIPFDFEISIVLINDGKKIIHFPISRNIHRQGILDLSIVPAMISPKLEQEVIEKSKAFVKSCGYQGILAIEYFVAKDEIYFNEMAPRPHNSGHYSIEGCNVSQYSELCKFLLGMELEDPILLSPTVMKNILGIDIPACEKISQLNLENCYIHMYGKDVIKPQRKMGHITFTNTNLEDYKLKYQNIFSEVL